MGAARSLSARVVVALAIGVPWLAFVQPTHVIWRALLVTLLLVASFHGWGLGLAAVIRRRADPVIAVAWGIALVAAVLGGAMAASLRVQLPLLVIGLVLHGTLLAVRFREATSAVETALRSDACRWWIAPAILVAAIGAVHVLGAAGAVTLRPFDDDGHVLAQVRRLLDTGTLADAVGYARASQLGASVAFGGLAAALGDLVFVRVVDALGFVLVLVLVCRAIRVRDAATSLGAGIVIVTLAVIALRWPDPSPLWLPIALALALAQTVEVDVADAAMLMPAGLLAGALTALRLEWMPFAVILAAAAWRPRAHPHSRLVRAGVLLAAMLFVTMPYLFARVTAWSRLTEAVTAMVVPARRRFALAALIVAVVVAVARLLLGRASWLVRWSTFAMIASLVCVLCEVTSTPPYYSTYVWPLVAATMLILFVDAASREATHVSGLLLVLATAAVLFGYEARLAHSRDRITTRYGELVADLEFARSAHVREATDPDYRRLLALVPGARVAIWVVRPEQIDYANHAIVDLRVPRLARRRARPWQPDNVDSIIKVLRAMRLRYLLVEDDGAAQRYPEENPVADALCGEHCVDALARLLATQRLLGSAGATRLYELRWESVTHAK